MAELSHDPCCAPEQQARCCAPDAKADCCGHGEGCGCAGAGLLGIEIRETHRVRDRAACLSSPIPTCARADFTERQAWLARQASI